MSATLEARAECPINRLHGRFLLRQLEFSEQYASMYRRRVEQQHEKALRNIEKVCPSSAKQYRVLELPPGVPSTCVGVLYKEMKLLPHFLDEYQRELVRIDAGGDDDDDMEEAIAEEDVGQNIGEEVLDTTATREQAATMEHYSACHAQDEVYLEDDSGRVLLSGINAERFSTGIVLGVYGTLHANGVFEILSYTFSGLESLYVDRPVPANKDPCYVAVVCGLEVGIPDSDNPAALHGRLSVEMLIDFLGGRLGDEKLLNLSKNISRLVIGGNSIAPTDELRLKKKLRLDPSDHIRLNDDKAQLGIVTSARLMKEFDQVLSRLAAAVEVELLPGDNDMSDAFFPQQPLHPILLPTAAKQSSVHLVTNPFEFVAQNGTTTESSGATDPSLCGVRFFVSAGQNINDVAGETKYEKRVDVFELVLQSGCMCPTAPNTLFSYPFKDKDPFLFNSAPHCFIACDQPQFETRYSTLNELRVNTEAC
ncbi:DNA polymerase delta subunit 2 [Angomonas deanei]|uniref:DNA polymerase delta subunit OB-fold domain/DNA polymerase alpha/epsilon subunit B, putative n=1 Tax=Angomonas deanei TaxID=59799 RepID=A0A7G2CBY2_9TRYP|nr:DNA polymerase delta subunit 2 [Angomonas deanei]CAD2217316.1 DNA polymerase delta subunit OB-fold domain/DNA polymerase alpha/epsilon subunit B, putative [Angomonas deanei]|eukprot:EPY35235.1 DNA polymerase delta subunit 2 [Angomonas deanei]